MRLDVKYLFSQLSTKSRSFSPEPISSTQKNSWTEDFLALNLRFFCLNWDIFHNLIHLHVRLIAAIFDCEKILVSPRSRKTNAPKPETSPDKLVEPVFLLWSQNDVLVFQSPVCLYGRERSIRTVHSHLTNFGFGMGFFRDPGARSKKIRKSRGFGYPWLLKRWGPRAKIPNNNQRNTLAGLNLLIMSDLPLTPDQTNSWKAHWLAVAVSLLLNLRYFFISQIYRIFP